MRRDNCGDSRLAGVKEWASVSNLKIKTRFFISFVPAGEANPIKYNKNIFMQNMFSLPGHHGGFFF